MWNPNATSSFPTGTKSDTEIKVIEADTIEIDGEVFEFDLESVEWPDIRTQTNGLISKAYREDGELYLTVRRFYSRSCSDWDTGDYHDVQPEISQ